MSASRRPWGAVDIELLRRHYRDSLTADIARVLGRNERSVYAKAAAMGLKKSPAFLASDAAGRIQRGRTAPRLAATQFKPGAVPWNKGVSYTAGGRSAETRFKPGRKPQEARNYRPIGSLRVTRNGILEQKMTDDTSVYPVRRWTPVARLVWEREHGPIPPGHIVVFRPGQSTVVKAEITPDRLECISRAENARRNHPRNRSPELAHLVQLKGAITRQVNRIAREAREQQQGAQA